MKLALLAGALAFVAGFAARAGIESLWYHQETGAVGALLVVIFFVAVAGTVITGIE